MPQVSVKHFFLDDPDWPTPPVGGARPPELALIGVGRCFIPLTFAFNIDWPQALATAFIVFGLLEVYRAIANWWHNRKPAPPPLPLPAGEIRELHRIQGAADKVKCSHCGKFSCNYVKYADGDIWCVYCDNTN